MRVLYFGTYDRAYPRNAQVISALRGAGVEVGEQHRPVWERRHNWSVGPRQILRVAEAERSLRRSREAERAADALIVGYPGHFDLPAAKRVARGRPVVFNPLVSLYDTLVDDRGRFRRGSPGAGVVHLVDRRAFRRADVVVADTAAHAAFFREEFGLRPDRLEVCFVGAEDRLFRPGGSRERPFHVLFVGKLIPLHGLETILAAAALLPEIPFRVVGSGQLEPLLAGRSGNVEWVPWVEYDDLPGEIQAAGCALGIFGTGAKAGARDPEQGLPGARLRHAARHGRHAGRTRAAHRRRRRAARAAGRPRRRSRSAIRRLAAEPGLAAALGAAGRATYEARASEEVLGERWRGLLERAVAAS